jgi:hypothetical protein
MFDTVEPFRERVVLLAAFAIDAERLAVGTAGTGEVFDDRREARDELDVHDIPSRHPALRP